jgi:Cu-Zn family superoxide dismutase
MKLRLMLITITFSACAPTASEELRVEVHRVDASGVGPSIGTVVFADGPSGLAIKPRLEGLTAGPHGLHVHENASCDPAEKDGTVQSGLAAGGHYDPAGSGRHEGPTGQGHLGDLPLLSVDASGKALTEAVAPRLKLADLKGRSLMIHAGGDNYTDSPEPNGGGGARIACGVIP